MKKRYLFSLAAVLGAGILYRKRKNNEDHYDKIAKTKVAQGNHTHLEETIRDAGIPDQTGDKDLAQLENAKMVAEGSQFGVQYYNELKDREQKLKKEQHA